MPLRSIDEACSSTRTFYILLAAFPLPSRPCAASNAPRPLSFRVLSELRAADATHHGLAPRQRLNYAIYSFLAISSPHLRHAFISSPWTTLKPLCLPRVELAAIRSCPPQLELSSSFNPPRKRPATSMRLRSQNIAVVVACITWTAAAYSNDTSSALSLQSPLYQLVDSQPPGCPECPRCFDCHNDEFSCQQFAKCNSNNGKCSCPPGFGGDDCSAPLCGSLADGKNRSPREGDVCECDEGWEGINCNVCSSNQACNALMPEGDGGVCYKQGIVVKENFQMCNVTNQAILKQVAPRTPQVTFSCNAE